MKPTSESAPAAPARAGPSAVVKLTPAECAVVAEVARGLTNREVARLLGKSEGTVKNQLRSVYHKLGISRRTRLMVFLRS